MKHNLRQATTIFIATVVATVSVACGGAADPADASTDKTIRIDMIDSAFRPARLSLQAGSTVIFELPNKGKLPHNMHIASARGVYRESPSVSEPSLINGGKSGFLTWEVPASPGEYRFRCDYHEVEMVGLLTVQ